MKIVINEFQDESYENFIGAMLRFDSMEGHDYTLESMSFDTLTSSELDLFLSTWKDRADAEGVGFSIEVKIDEVKVELDSENPSPNHIADSLMNHALKLDRGRPRDDISIVVLRVIRSGDDMIRRMSVQLPVNSIGK